MDHLLPLGFKDFASEDGKQAIDVHDFLLTVGRADANPTTVLEAMAWGLIPICTPQSGYSGYSSIVNVPLDDVAGAAVVLRQMQNMPSAALLDLQTQNWQLLDTHFNWDRFAQQVVDAIESDESPPLDPVSAEDRRTLARQALRSPGAYWRPRNLVRWLGHNLRSRLRK